MSKALKTRENRSRADGIALWRAKHPDHIPPRLRTLFPPARSERLVDRAMATIWPWRLREYPGIERLRCWLLGGVVAVETGDDYRDRLPRSRARMASERLRLLAARIISAADELDAYAAERGPLHSGAVKPAKVPPPVE